MHSSKVSTVYNDDSLNHKEQENTLNTNKNQSETIKIKMRNKEVKKWFFQRHDLVYSNIALQIVIHLMLVYALCNYNFIEHYKSTLWGEYLVINNKVTNKNKNFFLNNSYLGILVSIYVMFGIAGGAHRLWSHRSYKANAVLRSIIAIGHHLSLHVSF